MTKLLILIALAAIGFGAWRVHHHEISKVAAQASQAAQISKQAIASHTPAGWLPCATNPSGKKVVVSESQRHLWACNGTTKVADYPVVTGYSGYAETVTPLGSYKISNKLLGIPLRGSDKLGSWNDFVQYWMPFLTNKYGDYGLHDATWRKAGDFGNISDSSRQASHGCVEMPLPGMKWLYNWAPIGTKVSVIS